MYFSLKKKIFYTVFTLFVFMATLFLSMFMLIYVQKYSQEHTLLSQRNQYVMSLLHENIMLSRELGKIQGHTSLTAALDDKQQALSSERRVNEQMQQNFNEQSKAFLDGMKIIGISSLLSLISIFSLGLVLQKWIITPIKRLTSVAQKVSQGDFSTHIELNKKQVFFDELDTLALTFNTMMENIETNIAEIKNSEQFFQALIDAIPDGIRVIDKNCNIILSNQTYNKQFKKNPESQKCYEAYGFDYPCPKEIFSCPLKEIKNIKDKPLTLMRETDGRPILISAAPLKTKNSQGFFIIESFKDLSDDIKFSHEQKISSLGFLATAVAHEMKNNLGSIRMISEALIENKSSDIEQNADLKKYLRLIYDQIVASIELPERLLNLAKRGKEVEEVFDIKAPIFDVLQLLDYEAKRNGVHIEPKLSKTECKISGNAIDFKMIVLNLAQNALKATKSGGKIVVSTASEKNFVVLKMKDTGVGIEPEELPHIFQPFYSQGQRSRHQGTGVGLAIVKSLVEKFKGTISVSSAPKKGTVFEIRFPKALKKIIANEKK